MQEEIWKDIPNYEGLYQVSNLGNVKSLSREILKRGKYPFICKERMLKNRVNTRGYNQFILSSNRNRKTFTTHQLVAMAFLNHKPDGTHKLVVDHINANKLDNRVENLQVISQRENSSKDKKNKASRYTGVSWSSGNNKWMSAIRINGKQNHLGYFKCETSAHLAYQNKLKQII
jgi:hypothetical protein